MIRALQLGDASGMHARCIRSNAIHRTTSFAVLFPIPTQQCDTLMHSCMGTTARCRLQSAPMHVQEYSICMYVPMLQVPSCHLFDVTRLRHFNSPASRCSCCVFLLVQLYILWLVTFSRLAAVSEINVSESIRRVRVGLVDTPSKRCVGCIESHRSRYDTGLASTGAPPTGRYRVATTSWNPTSSICHRFESSTLCMGPAALPCSCAIEARTICTSNGGRIWMPGTSIPTDITTTNTKWTCSSTYPGRLDAARTQPQTTKRHKTLYQRSSSIGNTILPQTLHRRHTSAIIRTCSRPATRQTPSSGQKSEIRGQNGLLFYKICSVRVQSTHPVFFIY